MIVKAILVGGPGDGREVSVEINDDGWAPPVYEYIDDMFEVPETVFDMKRMSESCATVDVHLYREFIKWDSSGRRDLEYHYKPTCK